MARWHGNGGLEQLFVGLGRPSCWVGSELFDVDGVPLRLVLAHDILFRALERMAVAAATEQARLFSEGMVGGVRRFDAGLFRFFYFTSSL